MRKRMWMGPRGFEVFVPTPAINPDYGRKRWQNQTDLLNGGTTIRQSKAAHNAYTFEWNKGSWDDLDPIRAMADGVFDVSGDPTVIYFVDPTAAKRNLLPQAWASPGLGVDDALPLLVDTDPVGSVQTQSVWRLPARGASYSAQTPPQPRRVYVPIPPGFVAHFGWIGSGAGQVQLRQATATGANGIQTPAPLSGDGGVYTNAQVTRSADVIGVEIGLAGTAPVNVRAMTLQILPAGQSPETGKPWPSGMGNSGCAITDGAGLTPLSVPLDLVGASASLEEIGAWL